MVLLTQNDMGGLGAAIQQIGGALGQGLLKRGENQLMQSLLTPQSSQNSLAAISNDESFRNEFKSMINNFQQQSGKDLSAKDVNFLWNTAVQQKAQQMPSQGQSGYSQEQLSALALKQPQLASFLQQGQLAREKMAQKEQLEGNKRAYEENKPLVEDINKLRSNILNEEANLFRINEALDSGNIRNVQNFLADFFDSEYLRTAEGSDLLSAVKEEFLSDMQQMPSGTRLNQFLEKNMREALQTIGKDEASNRKITAYQQFKHEINKEKIKVFDEIRNRYLDKGLEPPRNLRSMVDERLKDFTNQAQKKLTETFKEINEGKVPSSASNRLELAKKRVEGRKPPQGTVWMFSPEKGQIYPIPKNKVKELQAVGGEVLQ